MRTLPHVLTSLLTALLLAACGRMTSLDGGVVVNPGKTSTLEVAGDAQTTLRLENASLDPVVVRDGDSERTLEGTGTMELTFEGPKTLTFRNEGAKAVTVRYEARSRGGVSTSIQQN